MHERRKLYSIYIYVNFIDRSDTMADTYKAFYDVCVCLRLSRLYSMLDGFSYESKCERDAIVLQHIHWKILGIGPDKHVGLKG